MVQVARPDEDISQGSWIINGGPSTMWEVVDEVTPNDATDYMEAFATNDTFEVGLSDLVDPQVSTGHTFRFRMIGDGSSGPERIHGRLIQGTTIIASLINQTSRDSWTTKTYTLTAGEADSITDYTDLRMRFTSNNLASTPPEDETVFMTWTEFEVPDAPTGGLIIPVAMASYRRRR